MSRSEKAPWKAAILAFSFPGLGHVYLREWRRATVWLLLIVSLPVIYNPQMPSAITVAAFQEAARGVPIQFSLLWALMTALSMRDAYVRARDYEPSKNVRDSPQESESIGRCPHCGQQLEDPELEFCQWCAEPLDEPVEDDGPLPW